MQVLSFRLVEGLAPHEVAPRLNRHLPNTMGIALSRPAQPKFNATWRSSGKEYRYRLLQAPEARWSPCAWQTKVRPERLEGLLSRAVGTRDFSSFHARSSAAKARTVTAVEVHERGGKVEVRIRGEGFGRFMVRLLVGAAVAVDQGEASEDAYREALERATPFPRFRAPANGLVLWEVLYPPQEDPFTAEERRLAPGVPAEPPFTD